MKKALLSFSALVLLSLVLSAQQFGMMLGGGLSQKTVTGISNETKNPLFTLNGYVFTDFKLGKKKTFSVLPSLGFTSKGIVYRNLVVADVIGNEIGKSDYKNRINYLQIDIPVCIKIDVSKAVLMFIGTGPYFAYAVSGRTKYSNYTPAFGGTGGELPRPSKIDFKAENLSRFDAGLVFQANAVFAKHYCAGLKWDIGLTNLFKNGVQGDSKNRMFGLYFGYFFNKK